jgi:hypothetical protein
VRLEGGLWRERRDVPGGGVKFLCAADSSGPPLPASFLVVSGAPDASPVDRGQAQGARHRIGPRLTEGGFRARDSE